MVRRGRKRTNNMYFGPEEEEAVVKFLNCRHIEEVNLVPNKKFQIKHKLGTNVFVSAYKVIPNKNYYVGESKFLTLDITLSATNKTEDFIEVVSDSSLENVTIMVVNELERNIIFNEYLKGPLDKMVESIIRKYKLYRKGMTFEELHSDTISFLITKVHRFEPAKDKKAYSYFGTIAKNYILGLLIKDEKLIKQTASYEDMSNDIEEREDLTYSIDDEGVNLFDLIKQISASIKIELNNENQNSKKKLNENEKKLGYALIEIFDNLETSFDYLKGGSKYYKTSLLETIRNYTGLSTKDIRVSLRRYKAIYQMLKDSVL